jgi:hypothetical protein
VISAREFCRERGFPHALFLTYAFDPLFFALQEIEGLAFPLLEVEKEIAE